MKNCIEYLKNLKKIDMRDKKALHKIINEAAKNVMPLDFPIYSIHFELTTKCNALCRHCYNNSGNNDENDLMTTTNWINFAKYIVKKGGVFECLISGGEPLLLGDRLFDIMDVLHGDGSIFVLMTNGYLLNDKNIDRFAQYRFRWFQISIDGVNEEYHDYFRNLNGCWKSAVNAAREISKKGIPLKIAHCVTPYNIDQIDLMCELANDIGCDELLCGGISISGRAFLNKEFVLNKEQQKFLKFKIEENREKFKNKMWIKGANSVKMGLENRGKRTHPFAVIRPNGDVKIDGMAPFVIGNILKDDFLEIWKNRVLQSWKTEVVRDYIDNFSEEDVNYSFVNYVDEDFRIY